MDAIHQKKNLFLKDNRKIGYSIVGDPDGEPVLYHHGWPGTCFEILPFAKQAEKFGVKIIGIDRPGCGHSDYQKNRTVHNWIDDLDEILRELAVQEFSLIGFSTGGIYAIETALHRTSRVKKIALISAVPYFKINFDRKQINTTLRLLYLAGKCGKFCKPFLRLSSDIGLLSYQKDKEKAYTKSIAQKPTLDKEILSKPEMLSLFIDDFIPDLLHSSRKGLAHDLYLLVQSFVHPQPVTKANKITQQVFLWHGLVDDVVPPFVSNEQHRILTNSEITMKKGEGHSMIYRNIGEILEKMTK